MSSATLEYIAAGSNRHSSAADWAPSSLAVSASNNIAIWVPEDECQRDITTLSAGHTNRVNCVKIVDHGEERILISSASDKRIRWWKASENTSHGYEEV